MEGFIVNGSSVKYKDGAAHFAKYNVSIQVPARQFTLSWAIKMEVRLSQIVKMFGPFVKE